MSAPAVQTTRLEASVSYGGGLYVARIAGYSASAHNPYKAVRVVAEKAKADVCGEWEVDEVNWAGLGAGFERYQVNLRSSEA